MIYIQFFCIVFLFKVHYKHVTLIFFKENKQVFYFIIIIFLLLLFLFLFWSGEDVLKVNEPKCDKKNFFGK